MGFSVMGALTHKTMPHAVDKSAIVQMSLS